MNRRTARRSLLGLALAAVVAVPSAAATAAPQGAFGTIENKTGRHLKGAGFTSRGHSRCHIWNKDGNATPQPVTWKCTITDVKPHTTTGVWKDMDGVTVLSSGYYYVKFGRNGTYRWVKAGTYTRFHDNQTATCYSGRHVHCVIH